MPAARCMYGMTRARLAFGARRLERIELAGVELYAMPGRDPMAELLAVCENVHPAEPGVDEPFMKEQWDEWDDGEVGETDLLASLRF